MQPALMGRATLRFLVTDRCNLRCGFCHNEFQGTLRSGSAPTWDDDLVRQMLAEAALATSLHVKFSGGEPLLRWQELSRLVTLSREAGASDLAVFTNLTLITEEKLGTLAGWGVSRLTVNLPSFDPETYAGRTGQSRWNRDAVIQSLTIARRYGIDVQLNMVLPAFRDKAELRRRITQELETGWAYADSWDRMSFIADDWSARPDQVRGWIREVIGQLPGATERDCPPVRSFEFGWRGKSLLASKCTAWASGRERYEADLYIVPPGRTLTEFKRGRAYR